MQKVKDLTSRAVQVISPDGTIREAAQRMLKGSFGKLPVGENDRMIGTISNRDIVICAVAEGIDTSTKVRGIMSDSVMGPLRMAQLAMRPRA